MSNRRERRRSESQQPLSENKDYIEIENTQEGKVTHGKRQPRRSSRVSLVI